MIRVLPTAPAVAYRYTCPRCGCHAAWKTPIAPYRPFDHVVVVCRWCGRAYAVRGERPDS